MNGMRASEHHIIQNGRIHPFLCGLMHFVTKTIKIQIPIYQRFWETLTNLVYRNGDRTKGFKSISNGFFLMFKVRNRFPANLSSPKTAVNKFLSKFNCITVGGKNIKLTIPLSLSEFNRICVSFSLSHRNNFGK